MRVLRRAAYRRIALNRAQKIDDLSFADNIRVFRVHIEQVRLMRGIVSIPNGLFDHASDEAMRHRVHAACSDTAARSQAS